MMHRRPSYLYVDPIEEFPVDNFQDQNEIPSVARPQQRQSRPANCIEISRLPPLFQPIFPYEYFNLIQSGMFLSINSALAVVDQLFRVLERFVRV